MTVYVDHRDFRTYAEGRELASRARAEAIRAIWESIGDWFSRRITTSPVPSARDLGRDDGPVLQTPPWARGELDQQYGYRG